MKLSTAIRRGSKGVRQITHELYDGGRGYCVLGAACRGVGIKPKMGADSSGKLLSLFPILGTFRHVRLDGTLAEKLVYYNDYREWSFKKIASWLRRKGL